jgi:hypothetical protein
MLAAITKFKDMSRGPVNANGSNSQCCRTVMICCGSGSDLGKLLVPVPLRIQTFRHSLPKTKTNCTKTCRFNVQLIYQKVWPLNFDFLTYFIAFKLDPDRIRFRNRLRYGKKLRFL